MQESYRGFVNTWECDENDHLNVQGYVQRFELAARHLYAGVGARWGAERLQVRHIRYHKECSAGDLLAARSAASSEAPEQVVHMLHDAESGALLATAIDTLDAADAIPDALEHAEIPDEARPRSLSADIDSETLDDAALRAKGYRLTYAGIVAPHHCGPEGVMDDQHFIARVTDGVAHAWSHAGFTKAFLDDQRCGRVAVEMKLSIGRRPASGQLLHLLSGHIVVNRSTITFRHVFIDSETRMPFATTQVTALVMSLETRRAVPFSDAMRAAAETTMIRD